LSGEGERARTLPEGTRSFLGRGRAVR
jgi:hypothetical protein